VTEGDRILVDRVSADVGETVRLDSVLLVGGEDRPLVGTPFVPGAAVEATVVSHRAGDKVIVFKFEARKRKRRKTGHRQQLSELRIGSIMAPGKSSTNGDQPRAEEQPGAASRRRPKSARPAASTETEAQATEG
jgi:large subunit ribosomal protein L21